MKNYSRQRAAILKVLRGTTTHPSAAELYNEVKKEIPNISLGTIYRNLDELEKAGQIIKIAGKFQMDRYDGDISVHAHFICAECGKVEDYVIDPKLAIDIMRGRNKATGFILNYFGICDNCRKGRQ
ncbi:MAG: transcriptional repressor [Clostridia bacterium]|nr:transcriptional repressor [Clostridia bacterium]